MLKDLTVFVMRIGVFPNVEVLETIAKYLEMHLVLQLKMIPLGYPHFIKTIEYLLCSSKRQFYASNNARVDTLNYPFGYGLGDNTEFYKWVETLHTGQEIDAVKFCKNESKAIWSRATIIDVSNFRVNVKFNNEAGKIFSSRTLSVSPYLINQLGTRAIDFEWRENLKKGDLIDAFYGRKGWLLFSVVSDPRIEEGEEGQKYTYIECRLKDQSQDIYSSDEEAEPFCKADLTQA
jgi:hypothetical protein